VRAPLENLGEKDLADLTALIKTAGVSPAL
jgi:hypothetical protein